MSKRQWTMGRSATDRLRDLVEAALAEQGRTAEEVAREARLPPTAFRALLRLGQRPSLDRADQICRALHVSMALGVTGSQADSDRDDKPNES